MCKQGLEKLRQLISDSIKGVAYSTGELKSLLTCAEITPRQKLEELRPLVFTDWEDVSGWAQEAYEDIVLAQGDQSLIDEYLAEFGVGEDGMCACHRRSLEKES